MKLYTLGLNAAVTADSAYGGYTVTPGDRTAANGQTRAPVAAGTDYALIRVEITNPRAVTSAYSSSDPATGGLLNPATGKPWGANDPTSRPDAELSNAQIRDFPASPARGGWRFCSLGMVALTRSIASPCGLHALPQRST